MRIPNSFPTNLWRVTRWNRVVLNGQIWVRQGGGGGGAWCGGGMVEAWWRRGGHKGHASLKFEKDGSLANCASGTPKSIADKKVQKLVQGGA
jgi:hypothetical protein